MSSIIRVGVLEDDPNMRAYLKAVLGVAEDIDLAFCVPTLAEAISVTPNDLDLCLIDLQLPDGNGTEFVTHLSKTSRAKALILTVLADKVSVMAAIRSGAHGYLLKDSEPHQILRHIKDTLKGETPVSGRAITHMMAALRDEPQPEIPNEKSELSEREAEILTLFAKGMSYKETSEMLNISTHTVGTHAKSIYSKLEVNSRNEAIFEALKLRWIVL
jgi:DNA-binding NarL/FixJ family response regulator